MKHTCEICEKVFTAKPSLKKHFSAFHVDDVINCNICNKYFQNEKSFEIHIKIFHKGQKDHKCESCGKSFSQEGNLKRHITTHL